MKNGSDFDVMVDTISLESKRLLIGSKSPLCLVINKFTSNRFTQKFEPSLGKDGETIIVAASKMGWAMVISQQSSLLNFVAF